MVVGGRQSRGSTPRYGKDLGSARDLDPNRPKRKRTSRYGRARVHGPLSRREGMDREPLYPHVQVDLVGQDGNALPSSVVFAELSDSKESMRTRSRRSARRQCRPTTTTSSARRCGGSRLSNRPLYGARQGAGSRSTAFLRRHHSHGRPTAQTPSRGRETWRYPAIRRNQHPPSVRSSNTTCRHRRFTPRPVERRH